MRSELLALQRKHANQLSALEANVRQQVQQQVYIFCSNACVRQFMSCRRPSFSAPEATIDGNLLNDDEPPSLPEMLEEAENLSKSLMGSSTMKL